MASSPVDVRSMLARQMVSRLADKGPQSNSPSGAGQQLSEQMSQLQGADPQMMSKALNQVKVMLVALYPKSAFQIPDAAKHISQAQKSVDAALKAMEQASATQQAVNPIVNQAGLSSPNAAGETLPESA